MIRVLGRKIFAEVARKHRVDIVAEQGKRGRELTSDEEAAFGA